MMRIPFMQWPRCFMACSLSFISLYDSNMTVMCNVLVDVCVCVCVCARARARACTCYAAGWLNCNGVLGGKQMHVCCIARASLGSFVCACVCVCNRA